MKTPSDRKSYGQICAGSGMTSGPEIWEERAQAVIEEYQKRNQVTDGWRLLDEGEIIFKHDEIRGGEGIYVPVHDSIGEPVNRLEVIRRRTFIPSVGTCNSPPLTVTLQNELAAAQSELSQLRAWKESAMLVMYPYQEIGEEMELTLGQSIHDKILPFIKRLKSELNVAKKWMEEQGECIRRLGDKIVDLKSKLPDSPVKDEFWEWLHKTQYSTCVSDLQLAMKDAWSAAIKTREEGK